MSESRTWSLPEEPPVGTVVGPAVDHDRRRWRRISVAEGGWLCVQAYNGDRVDGGRVDGGGICSSWMWVLDQCAGAASEYPDPSDPSDPDGKQSELDHLRAEVARLDQALRDAAENLTQAEKDRDDANQNAYIAEQRRSELNLRMREVSNWNARIVHVLLGSFDEKGDRDAQAAAAIGKAEFLMEQVKAAEKHRMSGCHTDGFFIYRSNNGSDPRSTLSLHHHGDDIHLRLQHDGEDFYCVAVLPPGEPEALAEALSGGSAVTS